MFRQYDRFLGFAQRNRHFYDDVANRGILTASFAAVAGLMSRPFRFRDAEAAPSEARAPRP